MQYLRGLHIHLDHLGADLGRGIGDGTGLVKGRRPRSGANEDVVFKAVFRGLDDMQHIGRFTRHDHVVTVWRDGDALGLQPDAYLG